MVPAYSGQPPGGLWGDWVEEQGEEDGDGGGEVELPPVPDVEGQQGQGHLARRPQQVHQVAHQGLVPGARDLHGQDAHGDKGAEGADTIAHPGE